MKKPPPSPTTTTTTTTTFSSLSSLSKSPNSPDLRLFGHLIRHCSAHPNLLFNVGRQLHTRLLLLSITPSNFLASSLITLYSRAGHLPTARYMFDQIPHPNIFSFNSLLLSFTLHSPHPSHPLHLFHSSFPPSLKPDAFTLSILLKSVSRLPSIKQIHALAICNGFLDSEFFVANGLISGYARSDCLRSARMLFDRMGNRNVVSWNAVISGLSQGGCYEECLGLYVEMEKGFDGLRPDGVTVASVLHACSEMKDLVAGMGVHQFAAGSGIEMDVVVWNSLVGFYAKCGSLEYAQSLFYEMPERNVVSYNTLITGYMSYGYVERAMEILYGMDKPEISTWNAVIAGLVQNNQHAVVMDFVRAMQDSGFRPNSVTLSSVLPTISFCSNLLAGIQVHCYAIRNGYDQNIYVATALIDAYAKGGFLSGARSVFERTKARSVVLWTSIISAYSSHGDADSAISLFNRMLESKIQPDPVTFTAVLSACAHSGAVNNARRIFTMMVDYKINPAVEHYACMVGVFSRHGMLKEAIEFINEMPVEPNAKVWGALLNGAAVFGDVELGTFVFEKLEKIEPESTGNYIVMANLYSKGGRWEEAKLVREKMKGVGLGKIPGCSWIEMSNGSQVFVARDASNERSEEMCILLQGLDRLMRDEGYQTEEEFDEETEKC